MGAVDTTYTFTATDTITSAKMNNIIDQTTMTSSAIIGTTLEVASGQLKVRSQGITSNEMGTSSVTTDAIADGAVTGAKLNSSVILVPAGAVMAFAMNSAPTGWVAANGASISTGGANAALFAAIGYTYGGSGGSFNLPDLRGYFVRGSGTNSDSNSSGTFGAKQSASLLNHTHSGTTGGQSSSHTHSYNRYSELDNNILTGSSGIDSVWKGVTSVPTASNSINHTHNFTTENPSVGGGTETRPVNIAMLYCIKL